MSKIPKSLREELLKKNVVPFIGAGVSRSVTNKDTGESLFPSWKEFIEILAQSLRDENKEQDARFVEASINLPKPKYLEGIGHAKKILKDRLWYNLLKENFGHTISEVDEKSLKLPKLIWRISNNLIITTNVDHVLQWSSPNPFDTILLDAQKVEYADLLRQTIPSRPTVWHLHGYIDNKEKVIFSEDQYRDFYKNKNNEAKFQTLLYSLTGRTILFIGYSLNDAYFQEQLEYIDKIYSGGATSYYILLHKDYKANKDIPDCVEPIYVDDYEVDLINLLEEMTQIEEAKDKFKRVMHGFWEYRCKVNGDDTFDGKEFERGGHMNFKIVEAPATIFGFDIQIEAERIWSREIGSKEKILENPLPWKSDGSIKLSPEGEYIFVYSFAGNNTAGTTEDRYPLQDDGSIKQGTFIHNAENQQGSGYKIEGIIETRKMTDRNDLEWSPKP